MLASHVMPLQSRWLAAWSRRPKWPRYQHQIIVIPSCLKINIKLSSSQVAWKSTSNYNYSRLCPWIPHCLCWILVIAVLGTILTYITKQMYHLIQIIPLSKTCRLSSGASSVKAVSVPQRMRIIVDVKQVLMKPCILVPWSLSCHWHWQGVKGLLLLLKAWESLQVLLTNACNRSTKRKSILSDLKEEKLLNRPTWHKTYHTIPYHTIP